MHKQEDPLNLQSLPLVSPPDDLWPAIEAGLQRRRVRRAAVFRFGGGLAVAAAVLLAFGLVIRQPPAGPAARPAQPAASSVTAQPRVAVDTGEATVPERLDALIALSQRLERRLRLIRSEAGGLPAQAVVYQIELEDLVVQVDEELSRTPDSLALWNQRVDLLLDLERLYESGLRREYHRMASL